MVTRGGKEVKQLYAHSIVKLIAITATSAIVVVLPHILRMHLYTHLLFDVVSSFLLYLAWRLWWLGPICSELAMLVPLIFVSRWNPFTLKTPLDIEALYGLSLCLYALAAGFVGSLFGYLACVVFLHKPKPSM